MQTSRSAEIAAATVLYNRMLVRFDKASDALFDGTGTVEARTEARVHLDRAIERLALMQSLPR